MHELVLSAVEFDVAWESLRLGPTPVVLNLPSPGRTHTDRRRIVAAAWAQLDDRGLAGPASELADLLRRLAIPTARIELRKFGPAPIRAVAAGRRDEEVLARRRGETVVVEPCVSLPTAIVGVLPSAPPGPGVGANLPTGSPRHATPFLRDVTAHAQLGVVVPDRWGVARRSSDRLDVLDTPRGRYLVVRGKDGWTTIAPTDARHLRHRVSALLAGAAGQSRSPCRMSCRPDSVIEPDSDG